MKTKFNIGEHVYLHGIVKEIRIRDGEIKYSVKVADNDECLVWKVDESVIAPSPETKITGRWIGTSCVYAGSDNLPPVYDEWRCSECGAEFRGEEFDFDYCPRCGSRMVDKESEEPDDRQRNYSGNQRHD